MNILTSFIFFLAGATATAEIIKPATTLNPAKGVITIIDMRFDYSVIDRGWMTSANINNGKVAMNAIKSFIINYESKAPIKESIAGNIWKIVRSDVDQKCLELGTVEYKDQIKSLDQGYITSFSAKVTSTSKQIENSNSVGLTANCLVEVSASK